MPFEVTAEQILWTLWAFSVAGLMFAAIYCAFPKKRDFAYWRELHRSPYASQEGHNDL